MPTVQRLTGGAGLLGASESQVRDVLLEALFSSGSNLMLMPVQDVFGWRDRVNEPATPDSGNWMVRLPWPSDRLNDAPEARERQATLRRWAERYGRV
jgi:4-alpha-glucanotransferase